MNTVVGTVLWWRGVERSELFTPGHAYEIVESNDGKIVYMTDDRGLRSNEGLGHCWAVSQLPRYFAQSRAEALGLDEPAPALSEGVKLDQAKPPLHLIAPDFLYAIADILDFGAKKYAPRNWEKGMDWSRVYRAAIGHLFDWFMRKGPDPETGKSHLWHAACCIMFLVCYEIRNTGTDDRP